MIFRNLQLWLESLESRRVSGRSLARGGGGDFVSPGRVGLFVALVTCVFVNLALLVSPASSSRVYLSADASRTVWNGTCGALECATSTSPCSLNTSSSISLTLKGNGTCNVTMLNGAYNFSKDPFHWHATEPRGLEFTLQPNATVSGLNLHLYVRIPVLLHSPPSSLLAHSTFVVSPAGPLTVPQFQVYNSTFHIRSSTSTTTASNIITRRSILHISGRDGAIAQNCYLYSTSVSLTLDNTTFTDSWLIPDPYPPSARPLVPPASPTKRQYDYDDDLEIAPSTVEISGSEPQNDSPKRASYDALQTRDLADSTPPVIHSFIRCTVVNVRFELPIQVHFSDSTLTNASLIITNAVVWRNLTFNALRPDNIASVQTSLPVTIQNVTFLNPNRHASSYFAVYSDDVFTFEKSSSISVSDFKVMNATEVLIGDMEITDSLSAPNLDFPPVIRALDSNTTWNLHSIDIENVTLDYEHLGHLIYTPSTPSKGISSFGSYHLPSSLPQRLSINWSSQLPPPTFSQIYPFANFARVQNYETVSLSAPFSPYSLVASFENSTSTLLTYRSYYDPQPQHTCSNPPPGFVCSPGGTLYAPGPVDQPSITIPPQSGNVVVVGNVTIGSGITFVGTESTLIVIGCAKIGGSVTIDVDPEKAPPKDHVTLITQSEECDDVALNTVPLNVRYSKTSCRRVSAEGASTSSKSQLSVLFVLDSSKCNVKWIVIGAVLGGVALIAVVVVAVAWSYQRRKIRQKPNQPVKRLEL